MHYHSCGKPKENSNDIFKELEVLDVKSDIIFPTFFYEFKLNIDNKIILEECLQLRKDNPRGVQKSNMGGWQSEIYSLFTIDRSITPNIQNLAHNVLLAANDVSNEHNLEVNFGVDGCCWWININEEYSYNVLHSHPGSDLIALYYPKVEKTDGELILVRCDGSNHISLFENRPDFTNFNINPEEGIIYIFPANVLHYVKPNKLNDLRISIAFNLSINK